MDRDKTPRQKTDKKLNEIDSRLTQRVEDCLPFQAFWLVHIFSAWLLIGAYFFQWRIRDFLSVADQRFCLVWVPWKNSQKQYFNLFRKRNLWKKWFYPLLWHKILRNVKCKRHQRVQSVPDLGPKNTMYLLCKVPTFKGTSPLNFPVVGTDLRPFVLLYSLTSCKHKVTRDHLCSTKNMGVKKTGQSFRTCARKGGTLRKPAVPRTNLICSAKSSPAL
jgi:hypothetical protein